MLVLGRAPEASDSGEKPKAPGLQRERVSLVLIDVTVTDRQGRPLSDLRPEEFTLKVDGHWVPLESVDVQVDGGAEQSDFTPTRPNRRFAFFFDALNSERGLHPGAVPSARRFLAQGRPPGDEAMVAGLGKQLKVYQEFTADPAKLLAALDMVAADMQLVGGGERNSNPGGGDGG